MTTSRSKPKVKLKAKPKVRKVVSISQQIRALLKQGVIKTEIARKLKCSYTYVWLVEQAMIAKTKPNTPKMKNNLEKAIYYIRKVLEEKYE